jgi:RimJ/RimL family protein N-acetyltransferase
MLPKARLIDPLTIPVPTEVRTARLRLSKASTSMASQLAEARSESYSSLFPWFHNEMGTQVEEAEAAWQELRLADQVQDFERRTVLSYYAFDREALIGMVGLRPFWRRGQVKLTYWVRSSVHRQGYGEAAVGAMVVFAFKALSARVVTTGHAEPNTGSARLARKLGFKQIARQPLACEAPDGTLVAGIGYAIEDVESLRTLSVTW